MHKTMKNILLIICLLSSAVQAKDLILHPIDGHLFIWGEHLPESEKHDLEGISFFVTGDAAEAIYKKMKSEPTYNECINDGTMTKSQGMFECDFRKDKTYSCNFGISTKEGKVYGSEPC